jgi:predicted enzyme related to lactoylglutathione lyase
MNPGKQEPESPVSLETVILFSADIERLAEFYREGLGIGPFEQAHRHLGCRVGHVYLGFDQVDDSGTESVSALRGPTCWFTVTDIQGTFDRLVTLGASVRTPPTEKPWGAFLASLVDPDGNVFGIHQR